MKRYRLCQPMSYDEDPHGMWVKAEDAVRLEEQRNRAWHTLSQIENLLTSDTPSVPCFAFLLAGAHKAEDAAEYTAVIETTTPETTWTDGSDAAKAEGGEK